MFTPRGTLLALVITGVLFTSLYPIRRFYSMRSTVAALQQEERELDQKARRLAETRAQLQTDAEIERLARELGYTRPGEETFRVVLPSLPPATKANGPADRAVSDLDGDSLLERWWRAVRRGVSGMR
ncbi:MAG TPA: septum formation initiator family protein [Actinomycetota bacterium]|nr:septum formation initiator family protein [Actinomycetota bacterium]